MKNSGILFLLIVLAATSVAQSNGNVFDDAKLKVEPIRQINTNASDISPFYKDDSLYFASVPEVYLNKPKGEKANINFYQIYSAALNNEGTPSSGRVTVPGFGSEYHEGPAAYCKATGEIFVTLSNVVYADTIQKFFPEEIIRLRLAIKKFVDGKWQITEELPFNDTKFHFAHPAISSTGDTLIFSSDMKAGSFGKTDLFMSVRNNGVWSKPVNLGNKINTAGDEMFPTFIHAGLLSFAANRRMNGLGGLDLYYTTFPETGEIKSLGNDINTRFDEFGLVVNEKENIGYFSSNRRSGGSDDIFMLNIVKQSIPTEIKIVSVANDSSEIPKTNEVEDQSSEMKEEDVKKSAVEKVQVEISEKQPAQPISQIETKLDNDLFFSVQLMAVVKPLPLNSPNFKGENVFEKKIGNFYKYYSGSYKTRKDAEIEGQRLRSRFNGAFIVAFKNGEIIPTSEAIIKQ